MTRKACCLLLALCAATPGCNIPQVQDELISLKNRGWSKIAWAQESPRYCDQPRPINTAFAEGWREAYYDVAQGGSGKLPLFPPVKFWSVKYQNPLGRDQIDAWFAGYRKGALAAEQDNVGYWSQIPMSGGDKPLKADQVTATTEPAAEQVPAPQPGALPPPAPEELPPAKQTQYMQGTATIRAAATPFRR
jgi:hypothetical protein